MVTFEQFKAMDIRIAKILAVEDHPEADKLYILTIDTKDQTKKIVAGIKQYYTKEELINRQIVVVNNLEPAIIRGVKSEGMLLAAKDNERISIVVPQKDVDIGSPVS